ncbi:hypothetical protein FB446DRAFT_257264 [Lentinula raphanica]|nr:hypothetical protein FB446DRAFT_257264 [Lentinula raphanica]
MSKNFCFNAFQSALFIGVFSSALAAPTLMSTSHYVQDLSNQLLEPVNTPVQGLHPAARTPGLDLMASIQKVDSAYDNREWDQERDDNDKRHIFFPNVQQVSDDPTQLRRRTEEDNTKAAAMLEKADALTKKLQDWNQKRAKLDLDRKNALADMGDLGGQDSRRLEDEITKVTRELDELDRKIADLRAEIADYQCKGDAAQAAKAAAGPDQSSSSSSAGQSANLVKPWEL